METENIKNEICLGETKNQSAEIVKLTKISQKCIQHRPFQGKLFYLRYIFHGGMREVGIIASGSSKCRELCGMTCPHLSGETPNEHRNEDRRPSFYPKFST